jgi:hypothetical protein
MKFVVGFLAMLAILTGWHELRKASEGLVIVTTMVGGTRVTMYRPSSADKWS